VKVQKPDPWLPATSANHNSQPSLHSKRILATPKLNALAAGRRGSGPGPSTPPRLQRTPSAASIQVQVATATNGAVVGAPPSSPALGFAALAAATRTFKTPLNKMRGLFSQYREAADEEVDGTPIGSRYAH